MNLVVNERVRQTVGLDEGFEIDTVQRVEPLIGPHRHSQIPHSVLPGISDPPLQSSSPHATRSPSSFPTRLEWLDRFYFQDPRWE